MKSMIIKGILPVGVIMFLMLACNTKQKNRQR
jgi:hypothetical protein